MRFHLAPLSSTLSDFERSIQVRVVKLLLIVMVSNSNDIYFRVIVIGCPDITGNSNSNRLSRYHR